MRNVLAITIMNIVINKKVLVGFLIAGLGIITLSCSDSENEGFLPTTYNINGKVEKGPFVSGSTIDLQPMDAGMHALGSTFSSTISDNSGNFTFGSQKLEAPFARLTANGYFFNEVKGDLSTGTLTLRAIVNLADKSTVNVNILTHLKYQRILNLITEGDNFDEANAQAQKEILTAFGLQRFIDTDVSQYSIAAGTNEAGALIAISSLLLVDRSEATLTEYLAKLSEEFGHNGIFSETTQQQIRKDRDNLNSKLTNIEANIISRYKDLGLSVSVKDLTYFFDWNDDGIAGNEIAGNENPITIETTKLDVPKEGGEYSIKITTTVPVFLNPPTNGDIIESITPDIFFNTLYEKISVVSLDTVIENNILKISVKPSSSRKSLNSTINIYDYRGTKHATLNITQEGNPNMALPKLGENGKKVADNLSSYLSNATTIFNSIDARYTGIISDPYFKAPVSSYDGNLSDCWSACYKAINMNLLILEADAAREQVYQEQLNTFNALYYYNMVVNWGGVVYLTSKLSPTDNDRISRSSPEVIFQSLISNLENAISKLDEKKNVLATNDINDFFFVSKDVARITLANICMYQGEFSKAKSLLANVFSNNYYQLEKSMEYSSSSKELILGLSEKNGASSSSITPVLTFTDVILSLAECEVRLGNASAAQNYLNEVVRVKSLDVLSSDIMTGIKEARKKALSVNGGYFAFLKRNGLAKSELGLRDYQLVLPIPVGEIMRNPLMQQNLGY